MSEADIMANVLSDPDNPPLTEADLARPETAAESPRPAHPPAADAGGVCRALPHSARHAARLGAAAVRPSRRPQEGPPQDEGRKWAPPAERWQFRRAMRHFIRVIKRCSPSS